MKSILHQVKRGHRVAGFTLIELLVVIAVISLLAAILFPVFGRVREKARQSSCASNEKQLGLAVLQYEADYDEYPPNGAVQQTTQCNHSGQGWGGQLYPYVKSTAVFTCPSDPWKGTMSAGRTEVSYALNIGAASAGAGGTTTKLAVDDGTQCMGQMWPISAYNATSRTVMMAEFYSPNVGAIITSLENGQQVNNYESPAVVPGYNIAVCVTNAGCSGNAMYGGLTTGLINGYATSRTYYGTNLTAPAGLLGYHTDGANFLFQDGHVKWLLGAAVAGGANNATNGNCGNATNVAANTGCNTFAATYSIY